MEKTKLYINIELNGNVRKIDIVHDDRVADAEIYVDGNQTEVSPSIVPGGAKLEFSVENTPVIITVIKKDGKYDYNCFVDRISVKDKMPFKIGRFDYPAFLNWEQKRGGGKGKFIAVEALKGVIIGCIIYLVLFFSEGIYAPVYYAFERYKMLFMLACLAIPAVLFAIIAIGDYRKNEEAYEEFKKYNK